MRNKKSIAILLGDPSGIGPELISKILSHNILKKINIVIIGEKSVFDGHLTKQKNKIKILDIGVGSGCILLSLLKERKNFYGTKY